MVIVDCRRRDLLDDCLEIGSTSDFVAQQIANRIGDLFATAVGDCDGEHQGVVVGRGSFSVPKHSDGRGRQEIEATYGLDPNAATVDRGVLGQGM